MYLVELWHYISGDIPKDPEWVAFEPSSLPNPPVEAPGGWVSLGVV